MGSSCPRLDDPLTTLCDPKSASSGALMGTPYYIAPEGWRGQQVTEAADVWALGVVLHELLLGRRPYQHTVPHMFPLVVATPIAVPAVKGSGIPEELGGLVDQCLDKEPGRRPGAAEIADRLERLLRWRHLEGETSPFRGLLPFSERHADLFFGRDDEVTAFLQSLREQPVVPVVGPSGAGKSSFVQAGVIARLRERGNLVVVRLRPGSEPFAVLARQLRQREDGEDPPDTSDPSRRGGSVSLLRVAAKLDTVGTATSGIGDGAALGMRTSMDEDLAAGRRDLVTATAGGPSTRELAGQLAENPRLLNVLLHELAKKTSRQVLLFVDQMEEVFTLVAADETRRRFVEAVCQAAEEPASSVRVVFTVRDDFLGRVIAGAEVGTAFDRVVVLRRPGRKELAEILGRPVRLAGYRYEDPALLDEMVASVEGEPACLPLVQFAAQLLWERRDRSRRLIPRSAYREMGGIPGALAEHADAVLAGMSSEQAQAARGLLMALVTPEGTRRVVEVREIETSLGSVARTVLRQLGQARLISVRKGRNREQGEGIVELAHESLIHTWGQLARWLEESKEDRVFLAEIGQAAELWEKRGRRPEEVWQGDALRDGRSKAARLGTAAPESVVRFLEAGTSKERSAVRRKRAFLAFTVAALAAVAAIAMLVAQVTFRQKRLAEQREAEAQAQRARAEQGEAEAQREGASAALRRGDLLEARAKLRGSLETSDSTIGRVLWGQLEQESLVWSKKLGGIVRDAAYSPDGRVVAGACEDGKVYLVDAATTAARVLWGRVGPLWTVAISSDGSRLAGGSE
ncbi:MAG: protein kinase, partial [Pseudomonadota bacterium]